jgi:hypothetical protein
MQAYDASSESIAHVGRNGDQSTVPDRAWQFLRDLRHFERAMSAVGYEPIDVTLAR